MRWAFRARSLVLVVTLISVVTGVLIQIGAERRREKYRQRAESFARGEADIIDQIADRIAAARQADAQGPEGRDHARKLLDEAERLARLASWHVRMERHYARAMDDPWGPLPPSWPQPVGALSVTPP